MITPEENCHQTETLSSTGRAGSFSGRTVYPNGGVHRAKPSPGPDPHLHPGHVVEVAHLRRPVPRRPEGALQLQGDVQPRLDGAAGDHEAVPDRGEGR